MPFTREGQTEAFCKIGQHRAPIGEFDGRWRGMPNGAVWQFQIDPNCRYHKTAERHRKKQENVPLHVLNRRASSLARDTRTTRHFILHDPSGPQWMRLLPLLEAHLADGAGCINCGRTFDGIPDVQLDHIHPPRYKEDWARHHARNIRILCGSSNNGKRQKADDVWVDEQYQWQLLDIDRLDTTKAIDPRKVRPLDLFDAAGMTL